MTFHSVKSPTGEYSLQSCLTKEQLSRYGVAVDNYPELLPPAKNTEQGEQASQCVNLAAIPQASEEFEFYTMRLVLNIPQVALRPKDEIPIERWDDGITAFLLNYMANSSTTTYRQTGEQQRSNYVQLYPGFNIGAWRIRNATSWNQSGNSAGKWQSSYIYATIVLIMALFISGEEDVISFTDSTTRSTIITNVPPALDNSAAALPKVKNGVIFKDNFGSVIVCDHVECKRQ
ncbi:outer membrane usher protein psaC [Yersinia enterocolitica]|nr:outer membrane usher protein psaC [Yersinia enterocolitica]